MNQEILYRAWKRKRDAEIAFESANAALTTASRLLDELLEEHAKEMECSACAGKKDGKKCRAHANRHLQWKK